MRKRFEFRCDNPKCGFQSSVEYHNADTVSAWCPDCHRQMAPTGFRPEASLTETSNQQGNGT
jgi:hypothetical protein